MVFEFNTMSSAAGDDLSNLSSPSVTEEELNVAKKSSIQHLYGGAIPKSVKKYDCRSKYFSRKSESGAIQKKTLSWSKKSLRSEPGRSYHPSQEVMLGRSSLCDLNVLCSSAGYVS